MDAKLWQDQLIALYCFLSDEYSDHLWTHVMRLSPNAKPDFTDVEVLTVYLFGLLEHPGSSVKAIYRSTAAHLRTWFPHLPSYQGYVQRLNALDALLPPLVADLSKVLLQSRCSSSTHLLDSMPVVLAQGVRADKARVASEVADMGYCASKRTYFYGVKLHALSLHAPHALPTLERLWISAGSESDLTVAKSYEDQLPEGELYADKIYQDRPWQHHLLAKKQLVIHTPKRRARGVAPLDAADRLYGRAVSSVRQGIECFFAWLQRQTNIQGASRVRSTSGLWVHVFGRIAAALIMLYFNS
jgi:hypothetical protein